MDNIIVDLETSGLIPRVHGVLDIGAVAPKSNQEFSMRCHLYYGQEISSVAQKINGLSKEEMFDKSLPTQQEAAEHFFNWVKGITDAPMLVAHNARFEYDWLYYLSDLLNNTENLLNNTENYPWPFGYRVLDIHSIYWAKTGKSGSLDDISRDLGIIPEPRPHRAINGARQAYKVMQELFS